MRVTLTDIANYVNFSVSTVSRVLNDHPHVDEETRSIVRQAAEELNYPLKNLRAPREGHTVLFLRHDDEPESQHIPTSGIEHALIHGANSVLKPTRIRSYVHSMLLTDSYDDNFDLPELRYHAVMLIGGRSTMDLLEAIYNAGIPAIVAGAPAHHPQIGAVYPDYLDGMRQIVEHLAVTGRRNIGLVNGPATTGSSIAKWHGYRLGLSLSGLPFVESMVTATNFTAETAETATHALMERHPNLDAIVFADDDAALVGLHVIKSLGKRIPADVAVTGFHDTKYASYSDPTLTTIRDDMRLVGQQAAIRLRQLIENRETHTPLRTIVPVQLVVRASS